MQRFNIGERVLLLPRFTHLYPAEPGVIIEVKLDTFRPNFNEYKIEFPNGLIANVFEFQIWKAVD
jgi:hypothetical protein